MYKSYFRESFASLLTESRLSVVALHLPNHRKQLNYIFFPKADIIAGKCSLPPAPGSYGLHGPYIPTASRFIFWNFILVSNDKAQDRSVLLKAT